MSDKRYFGGSTVKGKVRQLTASSFKDLVDCYFNVPVIKKFTRREFDSYDDDTQKKVKDGAFVTAAVFNGNEVERNTENCIAVTAALLDFDSLEPKDITEGFADYAQQLYEAPEVIKEQLWPYNFVCYETIRSRKGCRRVRVLVDLQEMDVKFHKAAVRHIASLLGVTVNRWKGRIESMTLPLPMFRPVQFQDEDFTAVICSRTDGQELDDLDIPLEEIEQIEDGDRSYAYEGSTEDLSMMDLPVPGLSVEDVVKVLESIEPDDDYHTWVMVGMALRHQFRGEEEAKQAFDLFDDWSSRGSKGKYVDRDEIYTKWDSFKPDTTGRAPRTIRSVFEKAKEKGWDPTSLTKKVKRDLATWIKKCVDPDELMQRGPDKIAALPFKDGVMEEALAVGILTRLKELGGPAISKLTLLKAIRSNRRKKSLTEDDDCPTWLRPWVFITTKNKFRHMGNGIELPTPAFDNTYSRDLMNLAPDSDSLLTGKPVVAPTQFALNIKNIKRVDGTTYDPTHEGEEPFFEHDGRVFLNEFRASTIPRLDPENAKKAGKIFTHHVKLVVGPEHFKTVMDFMAHTVQFPGIVIRWALLIQSAQGSGKNVIFNALGHALGYKANFKVVNAKHIFSEWSDWLGGSQFIVLDEIKVPKHSGAELMNALKDLITNDDFTLTAKFESLQIARNVANKVALTNVMDSLFLEDTDRRWMPIKSPIQTASQCPNREHFEKFVKLYKYGGALRQFLLDWEISPDFPTNGPAPKTEFRTEMIHESKNEMQEEIEDLIENPEIPMVGCDVIFTPALLSRLTATSKYYKPTHFLRKLGYEPYDLSRKVSIGGTRGSIWVHRDNYDSEYGSPIAILTERLQFEEEKRFLRLTNRP